MYLEFLSLKMTDFIKGNSSIVGRFFCLQAVRQTLLPAHQML